MKVELIGGPCCGEVVECKSDKFLLPINSATRVSVYVKCKPNWFHAHPSKVYFYHKGEEEWTA